MLCSIYIWYICGIYNFLSVGVFKRNCGNLKVKLNSWKRLTKGKVDVERNQKKLVTTSPRVWTVGMDSGRKCVLCIINRSCLNYYSTNDLSE